jgi:hypothetical protein
MSKNQSIDKDIFKQIFRDHWEEFKKKFKRYSSKYYEEVIKKMLNCGDVKSGFEVRLFVYKSLTFAYTPVYKYMV